MSLPINHRLGPAQRDASSQPTARWPDCIELGNAPPRHIEYSPSFREPFYKGHRLDLNNGHQSALRKAVTAEKRVVGFGGSVGYGNFASVLDHFFSPPLLSIARVRCALLRNHASDSGADWCLQSDIPSVSPLLTWP